MANRKITELNALTGANATDTDVFAIVDVSADETKKITLGEFKNALDTGSGFVRITGDTMTGNLGFGDNDKAIFGAGSDLQIYHNGSNSYIDDTGTGSLYIRGEQVRITNADGTVDGIQFNPADNGRVKLFFNDATKLQTTSTGIDVTGTITADLLTVGDTSASASRIFITSSSTGESELRLGDTDTDAGSIAYQNSSDTMEFRAAAGVKMSLNSSGLDVTGTVTADGLTVDGVSNANLQLSSIGGNTYQLRTDTNDAYIYQANRGKPLVKFEYGGDISFYEDTGTTAKFFWDASAESLGIGMPPTGALSIRPSGTGSEDTHFGFGTNLDAYITTGSNGNIIFREGNGAGANTERMRITSSGKVGIGTSSPDRALHVESSVSGASTSVAALVNPNSSVTGTGARLWLSGTNATSRGTYIEGQVVDSGNGHALIFGTSATTAAPTERMRIDSSGHLNLQSSAGSSTILYHGNSLSQATPTTNLSFGTRQNGGLLFFTNDTERMRIDSSGNVGIGTSSPAQKLNVNGRFQIDAGWEIKLQNAAQNGFATIQNAGAGTNTDLGFSTAGTERMRIDSSGNVGIGATPVGYAAVLSALQLGGNASIAAESSTGASQFLHISQNANFDTDNSWEYISTDEASSYYQNNGTHVWRYAASGTAGTDISWSEAMRIDSNGALLLGTTSRSIYYNSANVYNASAVIKTNVSNEVADLVITNGNNNFGSAVEFARTNSAGNDVRFATISAQPTNNTAGSEAGVIRFYTKDTGDSNVAERMRIDSSGNLLVGTTNTDPIGSLDSGMRIGDGFFNINRSGASGFFGRSGSDGNILQFYKDGSSVGSIGAFGSAGVYMSAPTSGGSALVFNDNAPILYPAKNNSGTIAVADNAIDLGASGVRFNDIYATNGTIQTSDRNEKQDIEVLSDAETRVAQACKGLLRKFRWQDAVAEKGDDARIHFGIIAQDLQDAFAAEGLDAGRYAMFISNTWWETQTDVPAVEAVDAVYKDVVIPAVLDEEGNELEAERTEQQLVTEAVEAKEAYTRTDTYETQAEAPEGATERTRLGVRYPELLAFIIAAI